jgi:hypothetical protein
MNDAEKVREGSVDGNILLAALDELYDATPDVEPDPMEPVHTRAESAAQRLLTELAEAKGALTLARALNEDSVSRAWQERAEQAEAKAVRVVGESLKDHNLLIDYEVRIQTLEAALGTIANERFYGNGEFNGDRGSPTPAARLAHQALAEGDRSERER